MFTGRRACVPKISSNFRLFSLISARCFSGTFKPKEFPLESRFQKILTPEYLDERSKEYDEQGFTVLHDLFTHETIDELRDEMDRIISNSENYDKNAIFTTSKQIEHLSKSTDYFLDSASTISFFYEKDAFDKDGNLVGPLNTVLNKVGHAMHDLNPVYHKF